MARNITKFEKVTFDQYFNDMKEVTKNSLGMSGMSIDFKKKLFKARYDDIKLPKRATLESAGYDFFAPVLINLKPNDHIIIPTGIRCKMNPGRVLMLYPRSGHGFKTGVSLSNTVGIIDADYYFSKNEGHIMVKLENNSPINKTLTIQPGEAFCQGVFVKYFTTCNDYKSNHKVRKGGFGSTDNKERN
ncbi:MAG: dUTP diphosphatase [Anaerostipes sp.]|uniref:dUTP diphosphatase n=1 Tax=Anaerostipes sp. TaxID=1872530 RepID=UPI003994AAD4